MSINKFQKKLRHRRVLNEFIIRCQLIILVYKGDKDIQRSLEYQKNARDIIYIKNNINYLYSFIYDFLYQILQ